MRALKTLMTTAVATAAFAAGSATTAPPTALAAPIYPIPDSDGFYAPPGDLGARANGDVLQSRPVPAAGFLDATAWQIQYRSTNSAGTPIAAGRLCCFRLQFFPGVPRVPVYERHGSNDPVPVGLAQGVAGCYCSAGVPVLFDVIPGADHGAAIAPGAARAFGYLGDRFAGLPAPSNC